MSRARKELARATELLARLKQKHGTFVFESDFGTVFAIMGQLSLALRHPRNMGASSDRVRDVLRTWIERLADGDADTKAFLDMAFPN